MPEYDIELEANKLNSTTILIKKSSRLAEWSQRTIGGYTILACLAFTFFTILAIPGLYFAIQALIKDDEWNPNIWTYASIDYTLMWEAVVAAEVINQRHEGHDFARFALVGLILVVANVAATLGFQLWRGI